MRGRFTSTLSKANLLAGLRSFHVLPSLAAFRPANQQQPPQCSCITKLVMGSSAGTEFPCSLTVYVPFPSHRLATAAVRTLSVDPELSQLVKRSFSLVSSLPDSGTAAQGDTFKASLLVNAAPTQPIQEPATADPGTKEEKPVASADVDKTILKTEYNATTNRMLRVAVNGFFESLGTVIQVMGELDTDVIHEKGLESLDGAQGVEQGMTGTAG